MDEWLDTPMTTLEFDDSSATEDYSGFSVCDKSSVRVFRKYYEPPLYAVIFSLGVVGNLLVIWIFAFAKNRVKTMTDVYLLNLAFADVMFLCTLPFWAQDALHGWSFGTAMCKITSAAYKINFFSSMLLLTCISVDRYIVIVQTTKAQNSKNKRLLCSKLICLIVWLLAVVLAVPELIFAKAKDSSSEDSPGGYCSMVYWYNENNQTKITVLMLQIFMGFCLPLVVMACCYTLIIHTLIKSRNFEKHKALRVVLAVVVVFVLSQLPYNALLVVEATQAANVTITDCDISQSFDIATQAMKGLAYTHCCLNPFLYAFVGVRFRKDLLKLLRHYGCVASSSKLGKLYGSPLRSSAMSDTDTTQALSL